MFLCNVKQLKQNGYEQNQEGYGSSNAGGGNNVIPVSVTTYEPQEITSTTAVCGGEVVVTQGLTMDELGICWGVERNPMIYDDSLSTSDWDKPFVCTLDSLNPNTTYHVKAFALRGLECYCGEDMTFTTLEDGVQNDDTIPENPNYPNSIINITIYLDSPQYQELHFDGGWKYLTSDPESNSRGIIVFRKQQYEFLAYDRLPPNEPDACTDSLGNATRLVVEFPFVVDHCNNAYYNILNGQIMIAEPNMVPIFPLDLVYPLSQYHTSFDVDGNKLTITN